MRASLVTGAPLALGSGLAAWAALELIARAPAVAVAVGGLVLSLAIAAAFHGSRTLLAPWHRASRALLGSAFVAERLLWTGVDPVPMMAFLVLLIGLGTLQSLERTFGPVYASEFADPALLGKVDAAALGAYARTLGLLGFTFVASVLLGLLVPFAAVRDTSLATAVGLSVLVLAIIALLALAPVFGRSRA